jgi:hypothetical protein
MEAGEDYVMKKLIISMYHQTLLTLTEYHAMKAYWGVGVQLHLFFDLGTRWR